jgi:hypothetical protein
MNETVAGQRFFPHFLPLLVGSCITCHGSPTESLSAYFLTALARVVICLLSFLIVTFFSSGISSGAGWQDLNSISHY